LTRSVQNGRRRFPRSENAPEAAGAGRDPWGTIHAREQHSQRG
jgi:hypothetical protein